jgi:3-hydroxybutyryl-CoA dehydrogenase
MRVNVLGAGTMGHGIAQTVAMAGHIVTIRDIKDEYIERGLTAIERNLNDGIERGKVTSDEKMETLNRISGTISLKEALTDTDLVVEAVPEDMELKQETLREVENYIPTETVIATNTSSLSVTEIADSLGRPERVIGTHFFNPVHIMELVEIVVGERTNNKTLVFVENFVTDIGKTAVTVDDVPGFVSSRLGVSLGIEAIRMHQEEIADPRDIDAAMELGYNHPIGPLELTDIVGLDVRLGVLEYLREELGERFRPPQILKRKVRAGKLGKKSGEGFYVWEDGEISNLSD